MSQSILITGISKESKKQNESIGIHHCQNNKYFSENDIIELQNKIDLNLYNKEFVKFKIHITCYNDKVFDCKIIIKNASDIDAKYIINFLNANSTLNSNTI